MAELQHLNPNQPQQIFYAQNPQQQGSYPPQPHQQQPYYPPQHQAPYNPTTQQQPRMSEGPAAWQDPEDPEAKGFEFNDQSIRKAFVRKVFGILSIQLAITVGIIALFVFHEPTMLFVQANPWMWIMAIVLYLVITIVLFCCENLRRSSPVNYILLGIFTLCMAFLMGTMAANFAKWEVLLAAGITVVVTVSLIIFALQTKWDFTAMGGILFVGVIILLILAIFAIIFPSQILILVYASLGALIFCIYLVYDVQLMMGGKHKYSISPEEYIFAAINIYIDIINIFMYILMIIGASR